VKTRLAVLLVLVLTAISLGLPEQPASATRNWHRVMLSRDGHHWKLGLRVPLFRKQLVLVPGMKQVRTFYVRNQSSGPARLRLVVRVTDSDGLLERVTDSDGLLERRRFRMAARADHGRYHRIRHTGRHKVSHLRVTKGKIVPVNVRVRLMPTAGNKTMDGHLRFGTRVRLTRRD
jgi:hypothetical protein